MVAFQAKPGAAEPRHIGALAAHCLHLEVDTYPKPGLVSQVDQGAHADMDAALLHRSADTLEPFFVALAQAGAEGADMARLRRIGIEAEHAMLAATRGVNTHRGAIFGLGMLAAAAGLRARLQRDKPPSRVLHDLGPLLAARWGLDILQGPVDDNSHGSRVARRHGVGGAREEAGAGFPSLYRVALPALNEGARLAASDPQAMRVHACLALIAELTDTNLLHRGGAAGLAFAQAQARGFIATGGVGQADWHEQAEAIHHAFVARRLSPGGAADLLAMGLFVRSLDGEAAAC
jgi:triphosphoribosyl-dephospho-CoA synthase